jgi:chitinase
MKSLDNIETYNNQTWGWLGCGDLEAEMNICLSRGTPSFPAPVANAVCGPQVTGTNATSDVDDWASLNPCPLNAYYDV